MDRASLLVRCASPGEKGIAKALVEIFPTHGYVISPKEAAALGLPIRPLVEYEFADAVRRAVRQEEAGSRLVHFGPLRDILQPPAQSMKKAPRKKKKGSKSKGNGQAEDSGG